MIFTKSKLFRRVSISALVCLGILFPIIHSLKIRSEFATVLNSSPHHTVFATYPFFSQVNIRIQYENQQTLTNTMEIYKSTNMYSGKLIYSLFYKKAVFVKPIIRDRLIAWYFCNQKTFATELTYLGPVQSIGIEYKHRRTSEIMESRQVTCADYKI